MAGKVSSLSNPTARENELVSGTTAGTLGSTLTADPEVEQGSRPLTVSIAGVPLRLKSSHDLETVNELVRIVDQKVRESLPLTKTGSVQNASILASLHLAEELLMLRRQARDLVEGLETQLKGVIEDLESTSPSV